MDSSFIENTLHVAITVAVFPFPPFDPTAVLFSLSRENSYVTILLSFNNIIKLE